MYYITAAFFTKNPSQTLSGKVYYATAFTFVGCYINFPRGRGSSSSVRDRVREVEPRGGSSSSSSVPGGGLRTRVRARIGTA